MIITQSARTALAALSLGILASALPAIAAPVPDQMIARPQATLQSLDKITARTSTFTMAVGETRKFGGVMVTLRACRENPPVEVPEAAAFLEVDETMPGEQVERVFSGWMFASSPALSALEHPVYDVWLLSCTGE